MPNNYDEWFPDVPEWTPPKPQPQAPPEDDILTKIWKSINYAPLAGPVARATEPLMQYGESSDGIPQTLARYGGAELQSLSHMINPLNVGLTALSGGSNLAAKAAASSESFATKTMLMQIAKALETPGRVAAGGMMGQGIYNATDSSLPTSERLGGAIEGILGGMGLRSRITVPRMDVLPAEETGLARTPSGPTGPITGNKGGKLPPTRFDEFGVPANRDIKPQEARTIFDKILQPEKPPVVSGVPYRTTPDEILRQSQEQPAGDIPLQEWTPPEEPQAMARTESGGTRMDIGDRKEMIKIFRNTYSGSVPHVATKELIQNAIDATASMGDKGQVNVSIQPKEHTISVSDNGPGLTRDDIDTVYTNLSGSGKRGGEQKTIGELGVGKTTYMVAGEWVNVKTVARDADGKLYQHEFGGSPEGLMDEFHPIRNEVPEGTPTGTTVTMKAPSDSKYHDLSTYINHFKNYSSNPVNVHIDQKAEASWDSDKQFDIPPRKMEGGKSLGGENLPETKYNVTIPTDAKWTESQSIPLIINARGMFQGVTSHYIGKAAQVPDRLIVDLDPNVPGTHPNYPLTAPTRERLKYETEAKIGKFLKTNLIDAAQKKRGDELTRIYERIARTPTKHVYYDGGQRYTPDEMERVRQSVPLSKIGDVTKQINNTLSLAIPSGVKVAKTGFVFEKVRGVNLRHPDPTKNETIALINPFAMIGTREPKQAAQGIVHATVHEWVHRDIRSEGGDFTSHLADAYEQFDLEEQIRARNKILKQLSTDGLSYTPEITQLLHEYNESRRRPATTEDILLREAGSNFLGPKKPGDIPPDDKPTGEGTPPLNKKVPLNEAKELTPKIIESVNKLKDGIKLGLEARRTQDKLYSIERAKRAQMASEVTTPGLKGYYQQLGLLKGELPKVPSGSTLEESDINNLLFALTNSNLRLYEQINAKTGLLKIMSGKAPQLQELRQLNKVFGDDFSELVMMNGGLGALPVKDMINSVVNVPKSIMASIDLSAPLRQGLPLIGRTEWWNAFDQMFTMAGSQKAFDAVQQSLAERPYFTLGDDSGLFLAGVDDNLSAREEQYLSPIAEKIPGVGALIRGSERAYVGFLNKLRADTFDSLIDEAKVLGHPIYTQEVNAKNGKVTEVPSQMVHQLARYVNVSTGRGSLGMFEKSAVELNTLFFSPRMIASRLTMLNPEYYVNPKTHPFVRRQALKSLFAVAAAGLITTALAKRAGGQVNDNPLSSDFGKSKFGNTRLDPWGGFQQYVVAAARFVTGKTTSTTNTTRELGKGVAPSRLGSVVGIGNTYSPSLMENKFSPIASFIDDMLSGRKFPPGGIGELVTDKTWQHVYADKPHQLQLPKRVSGEIINRYTPMFLSDLVDIIRDNPNLIPISILGLFGQSIQTFGPKSNPRVNPDQQLDAQP